MTTLEDFLDKIKNGTWHSLTELSKTLEHPVDSLIEVSTHLSQQSLLKYQEKGKWVKINPDWKLLLSNEETEENEHKPTIGTIIIPSKTAITIQNILISNTTEKDLELLLRICKESLEFSISRIID